MDLLIDKTDFTEANLVKFSQNIREDQIEPQIRAAQEYDLEPRLGAELLAALLALEPLPVPSEDPEAPEPEPDPTPELRAFLPKVKRYLVLSAYQRFVAQHGLNITQFGMTKTNDPQGTMTALDPQERAIILKQTQSDRNVALAKMTSGPWVFDGTDYSAAKTEDSSKNNSSIRAPKRRNRAQNWTRSFNPDLLDGIY